MIFNDIITASEIEAPEEWYAYGPLERVHSRIDALAQDLDDELVILRSRQPGHATWAQALRTIATCARLMLEVLMFSALCVRRGRGKAPKCPES